MIGGGRSGCPRATLPVMTEPEPATPQFLPYVPGPAHYAEALPPLGPPTAGLPPVSPAPPPQGFPPPPPRRSRTGLVIAAVVGAVVLVAGGLAGGVMLAGGKGPFGPKTFTANGTLTLIGDEVYSASTTCSGKGGYADIREGTAVTVSDAAGATVALGQLGAGHVDSSIGCTFPFSVAKVPAGKGFYGIEVSHRGVLKFSEADASGTNMVMSLG